MQLPQPFLQSLNGIRGFNKEAFEAVHASEEQVTSIRFNPVKPFDKDNRLDTLMPVPWCPQGSYLEKRPSFTLDPAFHAGAYYVQEASSMFLYTVLQQTIANPEGKKVLDLCAAPGGKSTLLASYFIEGLVVSNEVIKSRALVLVENITKWGSDNVIVTNNDPATFQALENYFDAIVIDAPCSGSGLFRRDPEAIKEWSIDNVNLCSLRQQRIIADVYASLKEDGILIYSTCSYSKEEDEQLLDWIVDEFDMQSLQLQTKEEWHIVEVQSDKHTAYGYRFYPYLLKGEGFFITAFKKKQAGHPTRYKEQALTKLSRQEEQAVHDYIPLSPAYQFFKQGESIKVIPERWIKDLQVLAKYLYIKKAGIELGAIKGKDIIPHHELALSLLPLNHFPTIPLNEAQALQYLRKKEVTVEAGKGWNLVSYCGLLLGWVKVLPNRINNYYPVEWRILKD